MTIELPHVQHKLALRSIERFFQEKMKEPIGNLAAEALLEFFVNEIGPVLYNQALETTKDRLVSRVADVESELYVEPFTYWRKQDRLTRNR